MSEDDQLPSHIRLIRDFVNTYEPQVDEESLSDSGALRDWMVIQGLLPSDARVTETDLRAAVTVREGLRNVLLVHAGHDPDPTAIAALGTVLAELPVRLDFDDALEAGGYRLVSTRSDAAGQALSQVLDAVRAAGQDSSWARLKVCDRDTCRWAFYDTSRNQVRRWCSMAGCGNYIKMRRARARRVAGTPVEAPAKQP